MFTALGAGVRTDYQASPVQLIVALAWGLIMTQCKIFFLTAKNKEKKFTQRCISRILYEGSTEINMKNEALQKLWPQMFIELVRIAIIEIRNKNSYMKLCLQQITDQK